MADDLLLPVDLLPGPVPVGVPVVRMTDTNPAMPRGTLGLLLRWGACPEVLWAHPKLGVGWCGELDRRLPKDLAVDLSPPPLDAAGWPARVDALPIVAGMVARAMGEDSREGVTWRFGGKDDWRLFIIMINGESFTFGEKQVPTLAHIDPAHPHADRLALIEVVRAGPWRTP